MPEQLSIDANNNLLPFEDYYFLRSEGIKLIEKLSGKIWTDYNTHDPGITLLEALCYTLTDLGYRTSFEIKDLLAPSPEVDKDITNFFYTARQILPCNPVTLNDYRKLIIDTRGVKNAWIEKSDVAEIPIYLTSADNSKKELKDYKLTYEVTGKQPLHLDGLYKVRVEFEYEITAGAREADVITSIKQKLNNHRNICEDFLSILPIEVEKFKIEAAVKVKEDVDIEKISARIFHAINNFFSPSIPFYTLDQMVEKGYAIDEIFDGPALQHGFISTEDLDKSERYTDIHLSDIIHLILDVDDVITVEDIFFSQPKPRSSFADFTLWMHDKKRERKTPGLDYENSTITFIKNSDRHRNAQEIVANMERVKAIYLFLQSEKKTARMTGLNNEIIVPVGEYMNLTDYFPFQHILPACYGMERTIIQDSFDDETIKKIINEISLGKAHHPNTVHQINIMETLAAEFFGKSWIELETDEERDKVKSHFKNKRLDSLEKSDRQVLQLRGFLMVFEQILSDYLLQLSNIKQLFSFDQTVSQTYFPQVLNEINDIEVLFIGFSDACNSLTGLVESESLFIKRRNKFLNHLLARFNEDMDMYGNEIKETKKKQSKINIENKAAFLQEYITLSNYRSNGFNYRNVDQIWDTDNVIGAKKRICKLLGIKDYKTKFSTAGHITIEKIILENKLEAYVFEVKHAENGRVLLKSEPYETVAEVSVILDHLLRNGYNRKYYKKEAKLSKHIYELKDRNQEDGFEIIAANTFGSNSEMENSLNELIETLESFSQNENFHIVEHILLRPKIDPQEKNKIKKDSPAGSFAVDLLYVPTIITGSESIETTKSNGVNFKFESIKINDAAWKLSLVKGYAEIMYASENLNSVKHVENRIINIRQTGTDRANYVIEKVPDNLLLFKLKNKEKILATSTNKYQNEDEANLDIDKLIGFFSYDTSQTTEIPEEHDLVDLTSANPYSFQISVIIPDWPARFREPGFKHLLEKALYMEIPAHVYAHVYWVDYKTMSDFENAYKLWLTTIAEDEIPDTRVVNKLINVLNALSLAE